MCLSIPQLNANFTMKKETWKNKQLAKQQQQQQKENLIISQPVLNETIYGAVLPLPLL